MPIYATQCTRCGDCSTVFRTVATRDEGLICDECGSKTERLLTAPMIAADCFNEYESPGTGKRISSPGARNDDLKRSGAIMWEPGIDKDISRQKESVLESSFAPIAAGVDAIVTNLVNNQTLKA
jgi:putative FmdB family regulatory protein